MSAIAAAGRFFPFIQRNTDIAARHCCQIHLIDTGIFWDYSPTLKIKEQQHSGFYVIRYRGD
jgi:hypothetical protein